MNCKTPSECTGTLTAPQEKLRLELPAPLIAERDKRERTRPKTHEDTKKNPQPHPRNSSRLPFNFLCKFFPRKNGTIIQSVHAQTRTITIGSQFHPLQAYMRGRSVSLLFCRLGAGRPGRTLLPFRDRPASRNQPSRMRRTRTSIDLVFEGDLASTKKKRSGTFIASRVQVTLVAGSRDPNPLFLLSRAPRRHVTSQYHVIGRSRG